MKKFTLTTKTYSQLASEFATAFKKVLPPNAPRQVTQAEALEAYRPHLMKQRQRGLTWKQIAEVVALPPISLTVSPKTLSNLFGQDGAATGRGSPAQAGGSTAQAASPNPNSVPAPTAPAKPASRRYILDPFTNLPITPPPA